MTKTAEKFIRRPPSVTDPQAFALRVQRDSMQPKYQKGDVLILSRKARVTSGADCWVIYLDHTRGLCQRLARVFLKPDGSIRLKALNRKYGSLTLEPSHVVATIRVVECVRYKMTTKQAAELRRLLRGRGG
jgi:phage repressor protein C with HTH and peptisase S24 domain